MIFRWKSYSFFIALFLAITFSSNTLNAEEISIGNKFVCDLADSENPIIYQTKKGVNTEISIEEAKSIAAKIAKKKKRALRLAKKNNASSSVIKKAKKQKNSALKNEAKVLACENRTLDPASSGSYTVSVSGSPNSAITGSCTFSYSPFSMSSQFDRALSSQSTVDVTCTMSGATDNAVSGDLIRRSITGGKRTTKPFIAGTSINQDGFSVIFCDEDAMLDCETANDFAAALADPTQEVSILFEFADNNFSGTFPALD